jgi:hypothetical protein
LVCNSTKALRFHSKLQTFKDVSAFLWLSKLFDLCKGFQLDKILEKCFPSPLPVETTKNAKLRHCQKSFNYSKFSKAQSNDSIRTVFVPFVEKERERANK